MINNQMASYNQLVKNSSRGGSKAQRCLHKILQIISTTPSEVLSSGRDNTPKQTPALNYTSEASSVDNVVKHEHRGLDIDLNITEPWPEEESESSAVEEKKLADGVGVNVKAEEGFMGLLIEAATLIFGEFKDDNDNDEDDDKHCLCSSNDSPKTGVKRKKGFWTADLCEEGVTDVASPPVVRSKRGRIQALPYKYKDSVLEPLTRLSRNRSVMVGNKRRPR